MTEPTIIEIDNLLVSSEILTVKFACNLDKCHGACCIIGDSGAPLNEQECRYLLNEKKRISNYIRTEGNCSVEEQGPFIKDSDGDLVTPLINGEECAYTVFDSSNNCFCGIEVAHKSGDSTLRKPISCWLYPIRVSYLSGGAIALNLHRWHICIDGYVKGEREGVPVFRFLKDPIIFSFGREVYDKLDEAYSLLTKDRII